MSVEPEKACEDGRVLEVGDFAECAACGMCVRWDLRNHPFWGFQNCRDKKVHLQEEER